ncbi:Bro-N domain-containing protein [Paenibacillus larvae]|nr:Bro-N domain-containing protein [Paenibacillus larvae]MDT2237669.1 Bro-N domain-containing protein [Paenibacillus larvae]
MIMKGGQPWFVLKDVCSILELESNPRMVKERLSDDVSSTYSILILSDAYSPTIINEDGLYDVILESRKSEAREFPEMGDS